jgi:ATP-dependent protease ClpP protease subunit
MISKFLLVLLVGFCSSNALAEEKASPPRTDCKDIKGVLGFVSAETTNLAINIAKTCLTNPVYETDLRVSSGGGDTQAGLATFDIFFNAPGKEKLHTIAIGPIASAAVTVFLSGNRRSISCNGSLLVHPNKMVLSEGEYDKNALVEGQRISEEFDRLTALVIARQTGLQKSEAERLISEHTLLSAKRAKELGFVHEIIGECLE